MTDERLKILAHNLERNLADITKEYREDRITGPQAREQTKERLKDFATIIMNECIGMAIKDAIEKALPHLLQEVKHGMVHQQSDTRRGELA